MQSEKERKKVRAILTMTVVIALYIAGAAALQTYWVYFYHPAHPRPARVDLPH